MSGASRPRGQALAATQASLIGVAIEEAMALDHGADAPMVGAFVVVFESEGDASLGGVMSFDAEGGHLSLRDTAGLLSAAEAAVTWTMLGALREGGEA